MSQMMDEAFHKKGYKPASDYDRCLERIENVLRYWKRYDEQHSPNEVVENLWFANHKFSLTRYWVSGISSDNETAIPKSQKKGNKTLNQQKGMPKAWLDMMDNSNLVPRHDAHHFHRCYGLKEFIVIAIYGTKDILYEMCNILLSILSFVAIKCKCQLPLFVEYASKYGKPTWMNPGILEYPGFSTSFKSWESCHMKTDSEVSLKDIIDNFQYFMRHEAEAFQGPAKVSVTLTYYINMSELSYNPSKEQSHYLSSTTDFGAGGCGRLRYDKKGCPNIEFYLSASWSDQLNSEVISCEDKTGFNPLDAPKWSVRVDIEDTSEVSLGDCLKRFLSLCSSTQTGSLLSNPEIFSMLKYRRIYKQTEEVMRGFKVRKVTSKLILKPEESLIPVESLDVILDFLFHDAKLQSSQHSNEINLSTTTTVEDDVEDKFFLSYKELSKYFKSTRPSSLLSRLAICMCIVNKYHGGLGAVNQLWAEFVLELKYCLENNCEIEGLEPVEPKLDYRELLQKLQILNRCIKKKDRDASSPITTININTLNFNEEFTDISELPLEKSVGLSEARSRVGLSRSVPNLRIQMLFDRILAKDAFYAANPGCAIGDFVRWCSDEYWMEELVTDEGKDKITNKNHQGHLNQWIQISDNVSLVFHESKRQRRFSRDDTAAKVLPWLASVKPSDLVFKLMPTLILSTVSILLEHPVCQLAFLREHLVQFRKKLIDQFHNKAPQCTSSEMKMLEEHIHYLVLIEQKMVRAQYLLKTFRCVDPSYMVSDTELEKYVSDLVEFKEAPVKTSRDELPSNTSFGKLIYKFFHDHEKASREGKKVVKERKSETEVAKVNLKPEFKEYVAIIDRSKTTGSCIRLHGTGHKNHYQIATAFTNKPPKE